MDQLTPFLLTGCRKTPIYGVALILALLDEELDFGESQ